MASVIGGDRMAKALRGIGDNLARAREVRTGFLDGADYPDGTPVALVAAINNFGAPDAGIPARPFFTNMVRENSASWGPAFTAIFKAVAGHADTALARMGTVLEGELRESIVNTMAPPNSPVTDLLKQRFPTGDGVTFADVQQARHDVAEGATAPAGKPLVWSGFMLRSISSEVS